MESGQITITLTSLQLERLEQLAQQAQASSLGDFVKEKVLALLADQKGQSADKPAAVDSATWQQVIFELDRLHKELRVFAQESTIVLDQNTSEPEQASAPITEFSDAEQAFTGLSVPQISSEPTASTDDPLDDLLEQALLKAIDKDQLGRITANLSKATDKSAGKSVGKPTDGVPPNPDPLAEAPPKADKWEAAAQEDQTNQNFKQNPPGRSGNFPPKKRN